MARFFIDRPIFAWVIAIVIMLAGALSILGLPVAQYPAIAPPAIVINASYPGASSKSVEDSVTQIIEQKLTGLDGLLYMASSSDSFGRASITLTFDADVNPDVAQMQVQNKLQLALPLLPQAVQQQGVQVAKSARNFLLVIGFVSKDGSQSEVDLSDFLVSTVQDTLSRVTGVGEVQVFGAQYAMRVWLDPAKLVNFNLTPGDVRDAILAQNTQVSAGQLGGTPAVPGQGFTATVTAQSRLQTPDQFEAILLRKSADGGEVRLGDVARVEIGAENYGTVARYNGQSAAGIGVRLAAGANALETANAVRAALDDMQRYFPPGVEVVIPYDTTPFVRLSIESVVMTLIEAVVLVFLVMYLFLQNLRATLIPTIAIPVVLLGTFAIMAAFGFSINTLTMFGVVLAIGLLVDDAIVVVENVERLISEEGLSPRDATRKSMGQITPALVGITLVLSAVFIPMAFLSGSTGVIYRQFSITIVSAMVLSVLVALTLTPALCASLLPPAGHAMVKGPLGRFFSAFNTGFLRSGEGYRKLVSRTLSRPARMVVIYVLLVAGLAYGFTRLPGSFLPDEDQGLLMVQVQLPTGATDSRTAAVLKEVEGYLGQQAEVSSTIALRGLGGDQAIANMFIRLKDWSEREGSDQGAKALAQRFNRELAKTRDARVFVLLPAAVRGLGSNAGFTLQLQDLGGLGQEALQTARDRFIELANQDVRLTGVRASGVPASPQLQVSIDDQKASALGLSTADVNATLSSALGGTYINDFINASRVKKVYMQGDASYRMQPEDVLLWRVRNSAGDMVPLSSFASVAWSSGPAKLERYNGLSSYEIVGSPTASASSGEAMDAAEEIIARLNQDVGQGIGFEWSGQSYQERLSGSQAPALYVLSILFVFLCLAALYESWSVPFSVMLMVPMGVIGAVAATWMAGLSNDVYFQIGLLTTVGLSAKNAILIVEYAQQMQARGATLLAATLEAVKLRLRPILMTSLAFMFGVLPLAVSSGAGSGSRRAIGTGVLGGMFSATVLGLLFVPVLYVSVRRWFERPRRALPDSLQEVAA